MRLKYLIAGLLACVMAQASADAEQNIRSSLDRLSFGIPVTAISETPLGGLYQVQLQNGRVLYASASGDYLIQGALMDVSGDAPRNLTAEVEEQAVAGVINGIDSKQLVTFASAQPKTHITVFTDVDCGYCRKLHEEVADLNKLGIEVRYAAFPRAGVRSPTAEVMRSIWCAQDQQAAMTQAKKGNKITPATCDDPVAQQYQLGVQLGVQGTPAIFLANGKLVPGYKPARDLAVEALANQ